MQKLIRAGFFAAASALLIPAVILTAAGAVRNLAVLTREKAAQRMEATEKQDEPAEETVPLAQPVAESASWDEQQTVRLLTGNGEQTLPLSEYLIGVVMGELPAGFEDAAVAAQVVAARTFTLRQMENGKHDGCLCDDAGCCQAWLPPEQAAAALGAAYEPWRERIAAAVTATDGQVLTYAGKLIDAVFFSCSGGRTEAAVEVWGGDVPYLTSVDSPGEEAAPRYAAQTEWQASAFRECILSAYPETMLSGPPEDWIGEAAYTDGGGIASLCIGGQAIPGTALRSLLGLNSTCFTVTVEGETLRFETLGFGHRVGMSQYGANAMAQCGEAYDAILAHYYPGTALTCYQK